MGFYTGNWLKVVHEPVANFVKLPDFFQAVTEESRFLFQFLAESALVSECRKEMVEHLVVPDDAFVRRASFESRDFVREPFRILRLESDALVFREVRENRPENYGNGDQ